MPLWKTRRLHAGFSGDCVDGSALAAAELATGSGQSPFEVAATAQRARPERKRRTINKRFAAVIVFIEESGIRGAL
jgi:hypothetical protein